MEDKIKEINQVEYFLTEDGVYIQDFIRFPKLINVVSSNIDREIKKEYVENVLKNRTAGSFKGVLRSSFRNALITGKGDFPDFSAKSLASIGVNDGFLNSTCLFSIVGNASKKVGDRIKDKRVLPIGLFDIKSDPVILKAWKRKGHAGVYFLPSHELRCFSSLGRNGGGVLCAQDKTSGAIHLAYSYLKSSNIVLYGADLTFEEQRPFSVPIGDRFIYPEHKFFLNYLHGVCYILARNNINLIYVKETMLEIPFLKSINKEDATSLVEDWVNG